MHAHPSASTHKHVSTHTHTHLTTTHTCVGKRHTRAQTMFRHTCMVWQACAVVLSQGRATPTPRPMQVLLEYTHGVICPQHSLRCHANGCDAWTAEALHHMRSRPSAHRVACGCVRGWVGRRKGGWGDATHRNAPHPPTPTPTHRRGGHGGGRAATPGAAHTGRGHTTCAHAMVGRWGMARRSM